MKDKIIDLTKKLVKYKSTHDRSDEKQAVLNFVHDWFYQKNFITEKFNHKDYPSLIVSLPGNINKNILMMAHLDVVSASDDMFTVRIKNDIMRGRGVLDNKGMVAMLMLMAEKLKNSNKQLPNIKFIFTTDEEIGGEHGADKLSQLDQFKNIDFIIVPDGGLQNKIVHKEKGIIQLFLKVRGKSAHGAKPWLGDNPIEKAFKIYNDISQIFSNEDSDNEKHWHSTVALTKLIAGKEINKIPEIAEVGIDIRYTENNKPEELIEKIKLCLDDSITIKKIKTSNILYTPKNHEHIQKYKNIIETEFGEEILIEGEHGGSDASHFMHLNVPIVIHRSDGGDVHAKEEWASISSIEKLMKGLEKFLENFK